MDKFVFHHLYMMETLTNLGRLCLGGEKGVDADSGEGGFPGVLASDDDRLQWLLPHFLVQQGFDGGPVSGGDVSGALPVDAMIRQTLIG
jgi:hypothetical protein